MPDLNPQQASSLRRVLVGEFDFFGLISATSGLEVPVLHWSYDRHSGDLHRTVECSSSICVPHGLDALIFTALLKIDRFLKNENGKPFEVTLSS